MGGSTCSIFNRPCWANRLSARRQNRVVLPPVTLPPVWDVGLVVLLLVVVVVMRVASRVGVKEHLRVIGLDKVVGARTTTSKIGVARDGTKGTTVPMAIGDKVCGFVYVLPLMCSHCTCFFVLQSVFVLS